MAFEMNFSIKGVGEAVTQIRGVTEEVRALRDEIRGLKAERNSGGGIGSSRGADSSSGAGSRSYGGRSRSDDDLIQGILGTVNTHAAANRYKEAERRKAQADQEKAERENQGIAGQALRSLGLNPALVKQFAPLVADLAATALPLIGAASLVAGIGVVGIGVANASSQISGNQLGTQIYGGGSGAESEKLSALASFLGLSGGQAGQLAESFGSALQGGGYGSAYFRSKGVVDTGIYTIDKSKNLLEAVDLLRSIKDDSKATLIARTTGIQELLKFRYLTDGTFQLLRESLEGTGSKSALTSASDYEAQKTILSNNFDRGIERIGDPIIKGINYLLDGLRRYNDDPSNPTNALTLGLSKTIGDFFLGHGSSDDSPKKSDQKEMTEALHSVTRALKDHAEYLGLGKRGQGAIPKGWTYQQAQEALLRGSASQLGDFGV